MSTRLLVLVGVVGALIWAAPAVAAPGGSVTATGTKLVKVRPTGRKSNSSIQAAVAAAQKAGIKGALASARDNAVRYAKAAGLTLGTIISVSDVQNNNGGGFFYGPYGGGGFYGPFGPNQYCGIERRPVFKIVNHKHKLVRFKKVHACIVPPYQATTLTVTYNAQ
jgi:hypothetical protein